MINGLAGSLEHEIVDTLPLPELRIQALPFFTGWFGPVGLISKEALQSIQL
jgi:hypothetical protein